MDTRTPRTPTGAGPGRFLDDEPVLGSVKVPSDPAQVIANHPSFRVQLATSTPPGGTFGDTAPLPAARDPKRRSPLVWAGRTEPGDSGAAQLLRAARHSAATTEEPAVATTQVLPRVVPVAAPRGPAPPERPLLDGVRPAEGAYDGYEELPCDPYDARDPDSDGTAEDARESRPSHDGDSVRHAYHPGRRTNLGAVLLPLRIFLGFISLYAGVGKLTDPVYFEGGEQDSMVNWLRSLEPWAVVSPLRDFAVAHPVGSGLTVAFLQIIVGVLTVCGLWQRAAAAVGALLSASLILTVGWRSVPAYDVSDFLHLAAWSPLIIAGAPGYSLDARLAGEARRRLGPRAPTGALRRRVLRRGAVMTTVISGLALLVGSLLGSAVRFAEVAPVPEPDEPVRNHLPGSPLPKKPGERSGQTTQGPTAGPAPGQRSGDPSSPVPSTTSGAAQETGGADAGGAADEPNQDQTVEAPPQPAAPEPPPRPAVPEPTSGSTATTGGGSTGGDGGTTGGDGGSTGGDGGTTGGTGGGTGGGTTGGGGNSGGTGNRGALGGLLG